MLFLTLIPILPSLPKKEVIKSQMLPYELIFLDLSSIQEKPWAVGLHWGCSEECG